MNLETKYSQRNRKWGYFDDGEGRVGAGEVLGMSWGWFLVPSAELDFINVSIIDHIRTLIIFFSTSAQASFESDSPPLQATYGSQIRWLKNDFGSWKKYWKMVDLRDISN